MIFADLLPGESVFVDANTLVYHASPDGHFIVSATANGAPLRFLVDTGATLVVLTPSDARAALRSTRSPKIE